MIDYSESYLAMKRLVEDVWDAVLEKRYADARGLCDQIVVEARITKGQIKLHAEREERNG